MLILRARLVAPSPHENEKRVRLFHEDYFLIEITAKSSAINGSMERFTVTIYIYRERERERENRE